MATLPEVIYGSDAMVRQLSRLDLDYIALVPGASFQGLHDSIVNFNGNHNPEIILCLHEEHSVAIAHGFAKVAERPMAAVVHDAVGLMHATMAVYNAHCDRAPLLLLGGNGPLDAIRRRPFIDWIHSAGDEGAMIRPFVKLDDQPSSIQATIQSLITATAMASQIPRGPTFVCLDAALQEDKIQDPIHFPPTERYFDAAQNPPGPSAQDVERVRDALLQSDDQTILFLFGRVNRSQTSWDERIQLAETYKTLVLTDLKLAAAFPTHHPLHAAPPQMLLSAQEIDVIRSADVIVAFDWVDLAGALKTAFPENDGLGEAPDSVCIVNVTLDYPPAHFAWPQDQFAQATVDIAVSSDVDKFVSALLAATPDHVKISRKTATNAPGPTSNPAPPPPPRPADPDDKIFISDLATAVYTAIPPSSICLIRPPLSFKGADLRATHPLSYLGHDGGEGVGSGPGNAVGAALALKHLRTQSLFPTQPTTHTASNSHPNPSSSPTQQPPDEPPHTLLPVAILGDGDALTSLTALWTASHHRIPLLVIVANNAAYQNDLSHQASIARARGRPVANAGIGTKLDDPAPDISRMADGLGAATVPLDGEEGSGQQVRRRGQLVGVLEGAVRVVRGEGRVVVVDVFVWPEPVEGGSS